ncbi:MAG: hypothetical protein MUP21_11935 [Dehalococcoidia bacterium]|nr:hypothetical protein [Dehalococcoidia bacterium]
MQRKWDVRIASSRKLFRALHDFLDDRGYVHEYEPLKAEPDAIHGTAIFKSELLGKSDFPKRDWAYLVFGILLLPTILLTNLGIRFIKQSRYTMRTIARIGVEGEAYLAKEGAQGTVQSEVLDVVSDARVTLDVTAGAARGEYKIWRPTENKRELIRVAEERQKLEDGLFGLLLRISQLDVKTSQDHESDGS